MADTNLTKKNRREMIEFLEKIKSSNNDDETLRMVNKIENALTEKKFGLVFEEHREEVDEKLLKEIPVFCEDNTRRICKDENLPWNFIIEGDNLQALYLLLKTHRGRINCIYIDPPYNTGARDWKYNNDYVDANDGYRHSKWLSMMKVRLELAKQLLNPENSVLICTIDEKEYLHLGCLLEEMFPEGEIQMISSVINRAGTGRKYEFSRTDEYIFFIRFGNAVVSMDKLEGEKTPVTWDTLRRSGPTNTRNKTKKQFYPIFVNDKTKKIESVGAPIPLDLDITQIKAPQGCTAVFPIRDNGTEMMWGCVPEEFKKRLENGYIRVGEHTPNKPQKYVISYLTSGIINDIACNKAYIESYNKDGSVNAFYHSNKEIPPTTNWNKPSHDAQWYGSNLIKPILGPSRFSYPKSLYAVKDCIQYFIKENKDAIILDFFAGSGTTMHAVNLMNAEDGGNRKCIMVTNNEIGEQEEKRLTELGYKKGDDEREDLGIAKYVTWPRIACTINGVDINGKPLDGNYGVEIEDYTIDEEAQIVSKSSGKPLQTKLYKKVKIQLYPKLAEIKKSDGFKTNVKYFKCDWTPRKPEDYFLSNTLLLHIKEMIELENAVEIDGVKNVAILNKNDYKNFIENDEIYNKVENVWVNQNIIFDAKEIEKLQKKNFKYIPVEYFGQELKDVAE